ncbi:MULTISPECIES: hypothetical protein [Nocardia]|uniref:hypothetical protein n=1 Tax=Nocardia TaxID=1817 RepID=UPI000D687956|nr:MULTISPECIES: hypothetical protein [Nocardia]
MTRPRDSRPGPDEEPGDGFGEFAEELKLLAETVLERVEPVLRHAADQPGEWSSCSWCPVCAAAALMRGEHHEVVAAIADHGTAIVTVLREALAGAPVEPVPADAESEGGRHEAAESEGAAPHQHTRRQRESDDAADRPRPGRPAAAGRARSKYVGIPVTIKA